MVETAAIIPTGDA
jgi:hypothetical protein